MLLLALGVPRAKCICSLTEFLEEWSDEFNLSEFEFVETFNPDNQDGEANESKIGVRRGAPE